MLKRHPSTGLVIALTLLSLWATSLALLLPSHELPVWLLPLAVLWQSFLYTGLFITAHDAMHGVVYPGSPKLNHLIGSICASLYGLFSYRELLQKHWLHHRFPASDRDPDFHDGQHQHPLLWYLYFIHRYSHWQQYLGIVALFGLAHWGLHLSLQNLLLFWLIPCVISSIQLFYFGTFLTHREPSSGFDNPYRTRTLDLPAFWSFLACYHFGYHEEHHQYPNIPWWQLPVVRQHCRTVSRIKVIHAEIDESLRSEANLVASSRLQVR